jgi:hypothetical protein
MKNNTKPTTAQKLLIALGVDYSRLLIYGGKRPSFTKRGPGRRHSQGNSKGY